MTVYKTNETDVVEVGADGVRYSVANDYSGTFAVLDLEPGAYRLERVEYDGFVIASVQAEGFNLNSYYTNVVGADMYSSKVMTPIYVTLSEPGKLGFSLPHGEGVIHPSIVRIL